MKKEEGREAIFPEIIRKSQRKEREREKEKRGEEENEKKKCR